MTDPNPTPEQDTPVPPQGEGDPPLAAEDTETTPPKDSGAGENGGENQAGRIEELTALVDILKNERLLALAEAENANKRAGKRISDNAKYAVSNVCKELLQVADNLGRALMAAPPEAREQHEALKNLALGVELTEKELMAVLESQGVRRIGSLDQAFDANVHNAVQEVENTAVPAGSIVQVLQDGYLIHDRLLRPAMVVVSRGGPKRDSGAPGGSAPAEDLSGVDTTA